MPEDKAEGKDVIPTGKHVKIPTVVVIKFDGSKIAHEHIYWDQASVLAQIGIFL